MQAVLYLNIYVYCTHTHTHVLFVRGEGSGLQAVLYALSSAMPGANSVIVLKALSGMRCVGGWVGVGVSSF